MVLACVPAHAAVEQKGCGVSSSPRPAQPALCWLPACRHPVVAASANQPSAGWMPPSCLGSTRRPQHRMPLHFPLHLGSRLCRNIDKAGGLDAYILNTPDTKLQSDVAVELRQRMIQQLLKESSRAEPARRQQQQQAAQQVGLSPAAAAATAPLA